jgi:hypothetical protein
MLRNLQLVGVLLVLSALAAGAAPSAALPFDGVAQGHDLTVPVTIHATNNLAGLQCDVLFDGSRLVCTNAAVLVSGPADTVVDGALIQPGKYRLLAYSPTGAALTNDVVCNVTFSALTNAFNGHAPLGSGTVFFGDTNAAKIVTGTVNPGLILVGDAFAFMPGGGRAQFRGATDSNYVIKASADLVSWAGIYTNTATNELVWTLDTNALVMAHRFYRSAAAQ